MLGDPAYYHTKINTVPKKVPKFPILLLHSKKKLSLNIEYTYLIKRTALQFLYVEPLYVLVIFLAFNTISYLIRSVILNRFLIQLNKDYIFQVYIHKYNTLLLE